jgi:SPP1 family predicted phage head-tail adaptor
MGFGARKPGQIAAGDYRHRVAIQAAATTANAPGEQVGTFVTEATLWADVESTGGSETTIAGQTSALAMYTVRHRYYAALTDMKQYLWQGLTLNIVAIGWDAKKIEMTVSCIQRDNL